MPFNEAKTGEAHLLSVLLFFLNPYLGERSNKKSDADCYREAE